MFFGRHSGGGARSTPDTATDPVPRLGSVIAAANQGATPDMREPKGLGNVLESLEFIGMPVTSYGHVG